MNGCHIFEMSHTPRFALSSKPAAGLRGILVGATGLEPATSTSRTWRATDCATPRLAKFRIHSNDLSSYWAMSNRSEFEKARESLPSTAWAYRRHVEPVGHQPLGRDAADVFQGHRVDAGDHVVHSVYG